MSSRIVLPSIFLVSLFFISGCTSREEDVPEQPEEANPASLYCQQQGGMSRIITETDGSQSGLCVFADESSCDEWAFYRRECKPGDYPASTPVPQDDPLPLRTSEPVVTKYDPSGYSGWFTYTDPDYEFSIQLPPDWVAEPADSDNILSGHLINFHSAQGDPTNLRMTFRQIDQDTLLWPTGVGQGDFVPQGGLEIAGMSALRVALVCPDGSVTSLWYH